jgi:hypothetical protein
MRPRRRQARPPEVIHVTQGQRPQLTDAVEAAEAEPVSQVRECFPGRDNILAIFREAQRLKA